MFVNTAGFMFPFTVKPEIDMGSQQMWKFPLCQLLQNWIKILVNVIDIHENVS